MRHEASDISAIIHRIRANVGILLSATGISMVLGFATVTLNAHAIGAGGVGVIALFQAFAAMVTGFFSIGSQQPMIRLGQQAIEDRLNDRIGIIAGLAILLDMITAVLAGFCALLLIELISDRLGFSREMVGLAQIYTIVIFLSGTAGATGLFRLLNRFKYLGFIQVTHSLLLLMASIGLYLWSAGLAAYIIVFAVIYAVIDLIKLLLALRLLRLADISICLNPKKIRRAAILSDYFSYAWTTSLIGSMDTIRQNADKLVLGTLFGPGLVGIYTVVKQIAGVFNKIMGPVSVAVFPEVAILAARKDHQDARRLLNRLVIIGMVLGGGGFVFAALVGQFVLEFGFGAEFGAGYAPLLATMIAIAINLSGISFGGFVQAFVSPQKLLHVYALAFGFYIVYAPVLIYSMDVVGASIGQVVFSLVFWLVSWKTLTHALP